MKHLKKFSLFRIVLEQILQQSGVNLARWLLLCFGKTFPDWGLIWAHPVSMIWIGQWKPELTLAVIDNLFLLAYLLASRFSPVVRLFIPLVNPCFESSLDVGVVVLQNPDIAKFKVKWLVQFFVFGDRSFVKLFGGTDDVRCQVDDVTVQRFEIEERGRSVCLTSDYTICLSECFHVGNKLFHC